MKIFSVLFVGFFVINECLSLKCKVCKQGTDCKELEDEPCSAGPSADSEPVCLTHIYSSEDPAVNPATVTVKKCATKSKGKTYSCQTPPRYKENKCDVCTENLCNENGAATKGAAALAVITAVVLSRLV